MLVWTAGKSGSSKSSPFFRQLSRSRSNSELITPPCFSSHPPLTRSHPRDSGPLGSAVRAGLVAREVAPEERVAAWHACRCWCQCRGTLGQAAAAESWALPRFLVRRPTQNCGNFRHRCKACVSIHHRTDMTALHGQGWHGRATNGGSGWQVGNVGWGKASPNTSQPAPTSTFPTQAQSFTLSPGSLSAILFV